MDNKHLNLCDSVTETLCELQMTFALWSSARAADPACYVALAKDVLQGKSCSCQTTVCFLCPFSA